MLVGTLGASLLGNLLTSKDAIRAGEGTIKVVRVDIQQARIFNAGSSFTKLWKSKVLLKLT